MSDTARIAKAPDALSLAVMAAVTMAAVTINGTAPGPIDVHVAHFGPAILGLGRPSWHVRCEVHLSGPVASDAWQHPALTEALLAVPS